VEEKMKISKKIILKEICNMEEHYKKLEKPFTTKPIPECKQINETLESLKQIQYHKKYPNNIWGFYEFLYSEPSKYLQNIEDIL
jgi:hypothetical protein